MFAIITRRRRAEDARVAAFLHAIELSERYPVDPDWQLQQVPDEPYRWPAALSTDTVAFPRISLAGTVL